MLALLGNLVRWGEHITGASYMWEGQMRLAEDVLKPALASIEAEIGRRHPLSCMFAAACAAIAYEDDRLDDAAALLANRLDMLERAATPETVMLAYLTASRMARARGNEHRALDLLEAMYALGVSRRQPRLCVASLAEQVRIHAGRCGASRSYSCSHFRMPTPPLPHEAGNRRSMHWTWPANRPTR
jgi:LuxR family transcriptional regulator, maltose regulon positive regulatory protein